MCMKINEFSDLCLSDSIRLSSKLKAWGARGRVFESLRPDQTIERPDQTDLAFFSSGARSVQFAATDLGNIRAWNLVNSHHFLVSPLIPRDHPFAGMVSDLLSILRMTVE